MNVSVAVADPVVEGLKVIVKGADWPAGIVNGSEIPLTTKAVLFVLAPVSVTLEPVAFKFPDAVPLVPTTTLPTGIVVGVTPNWPAVVVDELLALTPWHPVSSTRPARTKRAPHMAG